MELSTNNDDIYDYLYRKYNIKFYKDCHMFTLIVNYIIGIMIKKYMIFSDKTLDIIITELLTIEVLTKIKLASIVNYYNTIKKPKFEIVFYENINLLKLTKDEILQVFKTISQLIHITKTLKINSSFSKLYTILFLGFIKFFDYTHIKIPATTQLLDLINFILDLFWEYDGFYLDNLQNVLKQDTIYLDYEKIISPEVALIDYYREMFSEDLTKPICNLFYVKLDAPKYYNYIRFSWLCAVYYSIFYNSFVIHISFVI